jgi:sterol desaturase/sphingolipid hydroxylase (fatty acid hydroxylase superfamily)
MNADIWPGNWAQWRGAFSVAWLALLFAWEGAAPFREHFATSGDRVRHAARNLALTLLNAALTGLLFAVAWRALADLAARHGFGLLRLAPLPPGLHALGAVLLFDLWTYWWHRLGHRVPALWRFHRVHHADAQMDVTTGNRFHPGEILLSSALRLALIPLLGLNFGHVVLYETLLQGLVQLQHANVTLPAALERAARLVVVTPALHQVHHSRHRPETDSNYASLFSFWDRLFGSYHPRADVAAVRLGLDGFDAPEHRTVRGLLRLPFRE